MRKRKYLLFTSLLIIFFLVLSGCVVNDLVGDNQEQKEVTGKKDQSISTEQVKEKSKEYSTLIVSDYNNLQMEQLNQYKIDIEFDPEEKTYSGVQRIIYVNNENVELNEIYLHIYPNTFREKETAPFLFNKFESAFPKGFKPGYIEFETLSIDKKAIENYEISGKGNTILKIPLKKPLKPNEKVEINMEYTAKLPPAEDRFGYGDKTFNFGNWYPVAAVYDNNGWNLDPYYNIGDPFYSDTSNYNVTIKAPKDIIIASSGKIMSEEVQGDNKVWNIEAKLMRDFAWVASENFEILGKEVDGTFVKVYVLDNDDSVNNFVANAAYDSIKTFNKVFGKYPFGHYSVVATSFPSGMEYPGIVFIGEKYFDNAYRGFLETVIVHETGHQWWYSVVGNDEIDESWLDESLTSYSEVIYSAEKYGEEIAENYYKNNIARRYNRVKESLNNTVVLKPLNEFENWDDYGPLAYGKGAMFIHAIEEKYSEDTLYYILKEYYKRYRFLNATTEDFIGVCEDITGDSFDELTNEWLYH